jgi:hypothetical protein
MQKSDKIQLMGPLVVAVAVLSAEGTAYALALTPSSSLLWYLNLEVFSIFRKSRSYLGDFAGMPFAQWLLIAGPIAALAVAGLASRQRLVTAIASNLSFVYAAFLAYSWFNWHSVGNLRSASLVWIQVPTATNAALFAVLFAAAFVSFAASHVMYFAEARRRA